MPAIGNETSATVSGNSVAVTRLIRCAINSRRTPHTPAASHSAAVPK